MSILEKKITMAHGAGGQDSGELMRDVFGRHFSNSVLDGMEDASPIALEAGGAYVSTDSFVVTPVEFSGGDIGKLAVCGSVNDVLMMGAKPKYLTCGYILETGLSIEILDRIAGSMARAAGEAGVIIAAGDTKVIERRPGGDSNGDVAGLMINTTCIGFERPGVSDTGSCPDGAGASTYVGAGRGKVAGRIGAAKAKVGDAIIVSGTLGNHHACILSARMGIKNNIKSDCAILAPITEALLDGGADVHVMRDITRGGLATVLNEIALSSGVNIDIEDGVIPVDAEVKAFCGIMGLDPLYMGNEGKLMAIVDAKDADKALELMRATEPGQNAAIIGIVSEPSGSPVVRMKTRIGGTRRIDMLIGEGLPRIC